METLHKILRKTWKRGWKFNFLAKIKDSGNFQMEFFQKNEFSQIGGVLEVVERGLNMNLRNLNEKLVCKSWIKLEKVKKHENEAKYDDVIIAWKRGWLGNIFQYVIDLKNIFRTRP